jgi:hypothetical protein
MLVFSEFVRPWDVFLPIAFAMFRNELCWLRKVARNCARRAGRDVGAAEFKFPGRRRSVARLAERLLRRAVGGSAFLEKKRTLDRLVNCTALRADCVARAGVGARGGGVGQKGCQPLAAKHVRVRKRQRRRFDKHAPGLIGTVRGMVKGSEEEDEEDEEEDEYYNAEESSLGDDDSYEVPEFEEETSEEDDDGEAEEEVEQKRIAADGAHAQNARTNDEAAAAVLVQGRPCGIRYV